MTEPSDFDFQPTLIGATLSLRPVRAEDFDALYAVASDPLIWVQHPEPRRHQRDIFHDDFFVGALASRSAFAVVENASNKIIGSTRYYDWQPQSKEIAIGYTFLARSHWGGDVNREMKSLMLAHAFRWAHVVWFHIAADNLRSRKAIEKIGGVLSHTGVRVWRGEEIPYVHYRIDAPV